MGLPSKSVTEKENVQKYTVLIFLFFYQKENPNQVFSSFMVTCVTVTVVQKMLLGGVVSSVFINRVGATRRMLHKVWSAAEMKRGIYCKPCSFLPL